MNEQTPIQTAASALARLDCLRHLGGHTVAGGFRHVSGEPSKHKFKLVELLTTCGTDCACLT